MQVGLIAEFSVPGRDFDRFIAAARKELVTARKNEAGCLRFDIIVFNEVEGRGAFIEVFEDQSAREQHRELAHFQEFFETIDDIKVEWTSHEGRAIE
jgi:quinol monooxygenase YgiN